MNRHGAAVLLNLFKGFDFHTRYLLSVIRYLLSEIVILTTPFLQDHIFFIAIHVF